MVIVIDTVVLDEAPSAALFTVELVVGSQRCTTTPSVPHFGVQSGEGVLMSVDEDVGVKEVTGVVEREEEEESFFFTEEEFRLR